jgi:hypothetical protein
MIKLLHDVGYCIYPMRFFAPDDAGGSGGSSQGGGTQGQAANDGGKKEGNEKTPFDDLPWDELDDTTRQSLEKIKGEHVATLQRARKLEGDLARTEGLQRRFQAEFDRLKAQVDKQTAPPEKDDYLESVKAELKTAGYPDAEVDKMAPVFAGMFRSLTKIQKKEIGADLQPLAATVIGREAHSAFQEAMADDPLGMFQDKEVAQTVWNMVQERTKTGERTNPAIVANLGKIAWADRQAILKANDGKPPTPAPGDEVPAFNFPGMRTGLSIPGGGAAPTFVAPPDPNAPRTTLNADTEAALKTTFQTMGKDINVYPEKFKPTTTKGRRS